MAKKSWVFHLEDKQHTLNFEQGFSGKKKIQIDGNLAYESQGMMDTTNEFSFVVEGHAVVLLIKPGLVDSYDLMVDDKSLETGRVGPVRVTVAETVTGLALTYHGGRAVFSITLLMGLVFAVVSGMSLFSSGALTLADMMYLPLLFALIGLALIYWSLVKIFNQTVLTVSPAGITVKQGPVPWFGNREVSTSEIEKLYCESYERKSRSGEGAVSVTMTFLMYRICVRLTTGKKIVLLADLDKCYEALFVNRQLGRKLGALVQPELQHA